MNIKKMIKLKSVLLLCLVWICVFAISVQGQATPTPINCGSANTLADATTYELTADCTGTGTTITISSGTATLNGNGYTISGATGDPVVTVGGGSTLNLNGITFSGSTTAGGRVLQVQQASSLVARNVIFRGNAGRAMGVNDTNSTATLTNIQFLNSGPVTDGTEAASALSMHANGGTITINGATFSGNSGAPQVIRINEGTLTITGCVRVSGNTNAAGEAAEFATGRNTGVTITGGPGGCPKKKKKEVTPVPTATERPPTAATCIGLREATGIAVSATFGLDSGVQCQQLDGGGIGIQALAENYIAAVDLWGYVDQGVEVCFPQATGRIIFLDARMSPRSVAPMLSHVADGMLCASTETPGSIVLLPPE